MIEETARRLGVSEVALRMSIDDLEPHPTLEVVIAVVEHCGVDPTWLVCGEYDSHTHRAVVDDEVALSRAELSKLIASHLTPPGVAAQADPRGQLRLEA